ncbi:MAG: hypothetical protein LAT82_03850 [Nanoarchaeota archaeon]|nr:hypothetical protein [Nanoarchaeota archaeon]
MLLAIFNILTGLILLTGVIGVLPGVGKHLEKFGKWLGSFQAVFGIIAIVLALLNISLLSLYFWSLLIGGIILAAGILEAIPGMAKVAKFLGPAQVVVGIILLIVGIVGLF